MTEPITRCPSIGPGGDQCGLPEGHGGKSHTLLVPSNMPWSKTLTELADRVDALAAEMVAVAADLDWYGGFNDEMHEHSVELLGAASIARGWAKGIRTIHDPKTA